MPIDSQSAFYNLSMLQACSRIAMIKEVEVTEPDQSAKVQVKVKDSNLTKEADVMRILCVNGKVKELKKVDEETYIVDFAESKSQKNVIKMVTQTMQLRGQAHTVTFKEAPPSETKQDE